jgi:adenosylcobinamide kinase/adenosylcobinamide-phosphate guanylyltransferase
MAKHSIERHSQLLLDTLINPPCPIVIVSNEVGQGIVPDNSMSRAFVKHQGNINQKLAEIAQQVIFITAGLPQILKGPK